MKNIFLLFAICYIIINLAEQAKIEKGDIYSGEIVGRAGHLPLHVLSRLIIEIDYNGEKKTVTTVQEKYLYFSREVKVYYNREYSENQCSLVKEPLYKRILTYAVCIMVYFYFQVD